MTPPRDPDAVSRDAAMAIVGSLERFDGRRLSDRDRSLADEYARDVLGSPDFAPWLYVYSLYRSDGFREGWIPDNYFGRIVSPKLNGSARFIARVKTLSRAILRTDALPDVAYVIDGAFYDLAMHPITFGAFVTIVSAYPHLIAKADNSHSGRQLVRFTAKEATPELFAELGNCVVQSFVEQHEALAELSPTAVATLRVTTVNPAGGPVHVRAAYLRVGFAGSEWIQTGQAVRIAVVDDVGTLDASGMTEDWNPLDRHPDTGLAFAGLTVPHFAHAVRLCERLHSTVPQFGVLGWDVTIDSEGKATLLEWNAGHPSVNFSECTTGPNFLGLGWEHLGNGGASRPT